MKKIQTIFKRDTSDMSRVTPVQNDSCEWVFNGEGEATRKYDGTCCKIENGKIFKRREVKNGKGLPDGFIQEDFDEITGKRVGWVPVNLNDPQDKYHIEAYRDGLEDGTYELCGPKVQGNPEGFEEHVLVSHSYAEKYGDCPRNFDELPLWLIEKDIEGIVFHHPDGRMAKIKKRDFGLKRK